MKQVQIYFTFFLCCVFFGISTYAQGQTTTISGTVIDAESNESMPGVNIIVKGTTIGTSTNSEGNFELAVPSLSDTLVVSFIGYQTNEVPINGRTNIEITLQSQILSGDELVVTAFGLEREKKSLAYSTQDVNVEQMAEARELNPVDALAGKIAGLTITKGGQGLNSSSRVILRGERSFRGESSPLYIVDGVPSSMDVISANDIESIDVMKGPNAAALYGSSAQDGAIIITTKQAEEGEVSFSYNTTFTLNDPIQLRDYQNIYGQGSGGTYNPASELSWGPEMNGQMVDFWSPDPEMSGEQYAFTPQPNNNSDIFNMGYVSTNNIIASIGGETTQTFFSYTYTDAEGTIPNNTMQRQNISMRVTSQLLDNLSLDSRLSYYMNTTNNHPGYGQQFSNPMRHIYRLPRNIRIQDIKKFEYKNSVGMNLQHYWNPGSNGGANPYWTLNRNLNERDTRKLSTFVSLTYDFTDAISLMARGSMNTQSGSYQQSLYNDTYVLADNGYFTIRKNESRSMKGEFLFSYSKVFTQDWSIDANFGGTISSYRNSSLRGTTPRDVGLIIPNMFTLSNTQDVEASNSIGSPSELQALYSFAQVSWKDAIFLNITGRNDWSSTLPAHNRSYFYPSIGLSAVISDLISLPDVLSFAKIRASWAKVGSSAPPFHFARSASIRAGGANGLLSLSGTRPNPDLKPEETISTEIGLDLRFFDERLGLDITVYKSNTTNQLFSVATPVGSGTSSVFKNGGNIQNKGIEALLSVTPVQTNDISWNFNVNFAMNQNLVKSISSDLDILTIGGNSIVSTRLEEGEPFGQLYARGFLRNEDGDVMVSSNGLPLTTPGFEVPVANYTPDFTAGIRNSFYYKNLSMSFVISHRQGGTMVSWTEAILNATGVTQETLIGRDEGLIFGENIFSDETAVTPNGSPNNIPVDPETFWTLVGGRNSPIGEAFVHDATNMRLRELTIGYNLPQSVLSGLPISNLKLSLVGRNLFFLYRASDNLDPEYNISTSASLQGVHTFAPPTTRSFGASLKIDFK